MKYLLSILFIITIFSCSKPQNVTPYILEEECLCENHKALLKGDSLPEVKANFTFTSEEQINSFQNQLGYTLCNNSKFLNVKFSIPNDSITIISYVEKYCKDSIYLNLVPNCFPPPKFSILINSQNMILINGEIGRLNNLELILDSIYDNEEYYRNDRALYFSIVKDTLANEELIQKIYRKIVIWYLRRFSNQRIKNFQKPICDMNKNELIELKSKINNLVFVYEVLQPPPTPTIY